MRFYLLLIICFATSLKAVESWDSAKFGVESVGTDNQFVHATILQDGIIIQLALYTDSCDEPAIRVMVGEEDEVNAEVMILKINNQPVRFSIQKVGSETYEGKTILLFVLQAVSFEGREFLIQEFLSKNNVNISDGNDNYTVTASGFEKALEKLMKQCDIEQTKIDEAL